MYNGYNNYNPQINIERIDKQIADLERMKGQLQHPIQPITQNFQLMPNRDVIRYANSKEEVNKESVYGDTPFFSKDMSVLWVKSSSGEIKTYELNEIVEKDEKDLKIEFLIAQIADLKKGMKENAKSDDDNVDEPTKGKKSSNATDDTTSTKK